MPVAEVLRSGSPLFARLGEEFSAFEQVAKSGGGDANHEGIDLGANRGLVARVRVVSPLA
jgi:hypothetical protein